LICGSDFEFFTRVCPHTYSFWFGGCGCCGKAAQASSTPVNTEQGPPRLGFIVCGGADAVAAQVVGLPAVAPLPVVIKPLPISSAGTERPRFITPSARTLNNLLRRPLGQMLPE